MCAPPPHKKIIYLLKPSPQFNKYIRIWGIWSLSRLENIVFRSRMSISIQKNLRTFYIKFCHERIQENGDPEDRVLNHSGTPIINFLCQ